MQKDCWKSRHVWQIELKPKYGLEQLSHIIKYIFSAKFRFNSFPQPTIPVLKILLIFSVMQKCVLHVSYRLQSLFWFMWSNSWAWWRICIKAVSCFCSIELDLTFQSSICGSFTHKNHDTWTCLSVCLKLKRLGLCFCYQHQFNIQLLTSYDCISDFLSITFWIWLIISTLLTIIWVTAELRFVVYDVLNPGFFFIFILHFVNKLSLVCSFQNEQRPWDGWGKEIVPKS